MKSNLKPTMVRKTIRKKTFLYIFSKEANEYQK